MHLDLVDFELGYMGNLASCVEWWKSKTLVIHPTQEKWPEETPCRQRNIYSWIPVVELGLSRLVDGGEGVLPPVLLHGNGLLAVHRLAVVDLVHPVLEVLPDCKKEKIDISTHEK